MNSNINEIDKTNFARGSFPQVFQELDRIESSLMIIFYFLCYKCLEICNVVEDLFRVFIISVGRWVQPSLRGGESHNESALESSNLVFEAVLIPINDFDMTLAGSLEGRFSLNCMSIWCCVGFTFRLFNPVIACNKRTNCNADACTDTWTDNASGNPSSYNGSNNTSNLRCNQR